MKLRFNIWVLVVTVFLVDTSYSYASNSVNEKQISKTDNSSLSRSKETTAKTKKLNEQERIVLRKQIESAGKDVYSRIPKSK